MYLFVLLCYIYEYTYWKTMRASGGHWNINHLNCRNMRRHTIWTWVYNVRVVVLVVEWIRNAYLLIQQTMQACKWLDREIAYLSTAESEGIENFLWYGKNMGRNRMKGNKLEEMRGGRNLCGEETVVSAYVEVSFLPARLTMAKIHREIHFYFSFISFFNVEPYTHLITSPHKLFYTRNDFDDRPARRESATLSFCFEILISVILDSVSVCFRFTSSIRMLMESQMKSSLRAVEKISESAQLFGFSHTSLSHNVKTTYNLN